MTRNSKVQAVFGSTESSTCKVCGMTYYKYVPKDRLVHVKYHNDFVNGLPWKGEIATPLRKFSVVVEGKSVEFCVYGIDRTLDRQVKRVDKLLEMVNCELNAPPANESWKLRVQGKELNLKEDLESVEILGRAFVIISQCRAIGLVVTEPIVDVQAQARWMVHRTQDVVPGQVNRQSKLGISRIWIAPKWRRYGLANHLLQVVLKYSVFGMSLKPSEVAFSQPSHAGGLLAKRFSGVIHKSGEVLIPVYLEK